MFEVICRDGIGRSGELDSKTITPNILFAVSSRFKDFDMSEILLTSNVLYSCAKQTNIRGSAKCDSEVKSKQKKKPVIFDMGSLFYPSETKEKFVIPADIPYPLSCNELLENFRHANICIVQDIDNVDKSAEIYIPANSAELFKSEKKFVSAIMGLREKIGYQRIIYTPATGLPNQYALLIYLGIDFLDTLQIILNTRQGFFLTSDGRIPLRDIKERICGCKYCLKEKLDFEHLLMHNYNTAVSEMRNIRNAIRTGRLRELVEMRIRSEPKLVALLREADLRYYEFQEQYFPIFKRRVIITSKESLFRPDILRYQKRLKERYKKPESTKILLLLPCSAKKPYSFSKSHLLFRDAIASARNTGIVHEVIVTSPLGIVPRELELFYPAQQYEIPVTGDWDEYEIKIINELMKMLLKNDYQHIINHTGYDFIDIDAVCTSTGRTTSKESIEKLRKALAEATVGYEKIGREIRDAESMLSRALFQFGNIGYKLVKDAVIKGRYPDLRIMKNGIQVGMLTKERGFISLTLEGAKTLAAEGTYCVEIEDFYPEGDIFAVGVANADKEIRIGDDIAVVYEGKLRAVGIAAMSATEMIESDRGVAVKVRHYLKKGKG